MKYLEIGPDAYDGNYTYTEYVMSGMLDALHKLKVLSEDERIDACWFHGDYLDAAREYHDRQ